MVVYSKVVCFLVGLLLFCSYMDEGKVVENSQLDKDQELKELGRRIKALRVSKGYKSAEKFALDHNLSRVHYGRWEAGKKNITYKSLLILARAHEMTLPEFLAVEI